MVNVEELVQQSLPSIVEGMKQELRQSITWQVKEDAAKQVSDHVTKWISENVLPEITAQLVESKAGLITLADELGKEVVSALVDNLKAHLIEKLNQPWERDKIFKTMFGG